MAADAETLHRCATGNMDSPLNHGRPDSVARRWHREKLPPPVDARIVLLDFIEDARREVGISFPPENVHQTLNHGRGDAGARGGDGGTAPPLARCGIVLFVCA